MWHCIYKVLTINSASPTKCVDLKKTWVLHVICKIRFSWIIDLNMREKGVNLLRHGRGECSHCLRVGKDIWSKKQKAAFVLMNEPPKLLMAKLQLGWMSITIHRTYDTKIKSILYPMDLRSWDYVTAVPFWGTSWYCGGLAHMQPEGMWEIYNLWLTFLWIPNCYKNSVQIER